MNRLAIAAALGALLILEIPIVDSVDAGPGVALPDELNGWRSAPEDSKTYDRETLYDYIDGAAELYISYSFERMVSRRYVREGEPDIFVDIFDMKTSQNAFGVFSHSREVIESEFGQGSQYTEGLLLFWKDRYYVSILASPETALSKRTALDLARRIERSIETEGPEPAVLAHLPREGLIEESVRYFHHYIWLNSHYYVSDENILHIDDTTDAVLARYRDEASSPILLVVCYRGEEEARSARENFTTHYLPESSGGIPVRIEDGTWAGCRAEDGLLAVVFNAANDGVVLRLIADVFETIQH